MSRATFSTGTVLSEAPRGAEIALDGIVVRYAGNAAASVDGVTLHIPAGELTVLLGPSGSGKSTLLRTINRLVEPSAGAIHIGGRDAGAIDPQTLRRGIGYVIQAVGLFAHMTVAQNIAVVPSLLGWDRARTKRRVDELLALVRLDPAAYRDRYPRQLSGGEAQRVGVARALAAQPPVLLMDEPFGALDAIVRAALQEETLRIHRTLGTTIVFVTHDVEEALRIADRIVVMRAGRIVQAGVPLAMLATPADPFVAELLDTHDVVRRLGLVHVREVMRATDGVTASGEGVLAGATLREALGPLLLSESGRVPVIEDGRTVGILGLPAIRAALQAPA